MVEPNIGGNVICSATTNPIPNAIITAVMLKIVATIDVVSIEYAFEVPR